MNKRQTGHDKSTDVGSIFPLISQHVKLCHVYTQLASLWLKSQVYACGVFLSFKSRWSVPHMAHRTPVRELPPQQERLVSAKAVKSPAQRPFFVPPPPHQLLSILASVFLESVTAKLDDSTSIPG